jgi:DNA-binding CsgD family transcriptional regulator
MLRSTIHKVSSGLRQASLEFTIDELFSLAVACNDLRSWSEFSLTALPHVQRILFHDMFACVIMRISDMHVFDVCSHGVPEGGMDVFVKTSGSSASQLVQMWCEKKEPVIVTHKDARENSKQPWSKVFLDLQLSALAVHGLININRSCAQASIFIFGLTSSLLPDGELVNRLSLIVPFLQTGISNVVHFDKSSVCKSQLSEREIEVIRWIYYGKTNKEIGAILSVSPYTVKNHVQNVIVKLGAANRAHVVGKALSLGILGI